jgi:hypothetical protein
MRFKRSLFEGKRFVLTMLMSVAAFVLFTGQSCPGSKQEPTPTPVAAVPAPQAQAEPAEPMDTKNLTVESLSLTDANGNIRATLQVDSNGGPGFALLDANGNIRSRISLDGTGNPFIDLYDSKGNIQTSYWVENDQPYLTYTDKNGQAVTIIPKDTVAPVRAAATGTGTVTKPAASTASNAGMTVYVINNRPNYHLRTCKRLEGNGKHPMTLADAVANGYQPCKECRPPVLGGASAGGQPAAAVNAVPNLKGGGSLPAPGSGEQTVYVINGRPNYHMRTCPRLEGKGKHPMSLTDAIANGYQPCKVCRPPVK